MKIDFFEKKDIIDNKIAIFTLQGLVNYGNRLQNYAVEQLIKEYGFKP